MKLIPTLSAALVLVGTAHAAVVYEESFVTPAPYTTGLLNGQNSWTAATQTSDFGGFNVVSSGLSYTGLDSSGGAVEYLRPNSGGASSNKVATVGVSSTTALAVSGGPDLWASVLINFGADMERAFVGFDTVRASTSAARNAFGFGFSNGAAFLGEGGTAGAITTGTTGGSIAAGTTHLALLKLQGGSTDLMSLWINPDLSLGEGGLGSATITRGISIFNDGLFITTANSVASTANSSPGNNQAFFDELRVGSSFADVTPTTAIPEPSSFAALAGLGVVGFAATRRRRA